VTPCYIFGTMNSNNNKISSESPVGDSSSTFDLSSGETTTELKEKTTKKPTTIPSESSSKNKDKNLHNDSSELFDSSDSWSPKPNKKGTKFNSTFNKKRKYVDGDSSDCSSSLSSNDLFDLDSMASSKKKSSSKKKLSSKKQSSSKKKSSSKKQSSSKKKSSSKKQPSVSSSRQSTKQTSTEITFDDIPDNIFYVKNHSAACSEVKPGRTRSGRHEQMGPFYFPRSNNRKYPDCTGVSSNCPGIMFFKNNFTGNQDLLKAFGDVDKRKEILAKKIEELFMSLENVYAYDEDKQLLRQVHPRQARERLEKSVERCYSQKKDKLSTQKNKFKCHTSQKKRASETSKAKVKQTKKPVLTASPVLEEQHTHVREFTKQQLLLYKHLSSTAPDDTPLAKLMGIEETSKADFEVDIDTYPKYSMIHSFIEPFTFNVYHGSHKGHEQTVHRSSMLQLKIDDQMFVLFHGNLIHGGAQSKKEGRWSFNFSQDVRFFAYIDKQFKVRSGSTVYKQHSDDAGCLPSFTKCLDFENNTRDTCDCPFCKKMYHEVVRKYPVSGKNIVVDLGEMYKIKCETTASACSKSDEPVLIVGDLDKFGWAVYRGLSKATTKQYTSYSLFEEVNRLIHYNAKNTWRNIEKGRLVYEVKEHKNIHLLDKVKDVRSYFEDILEHSVKKIRGFEQSIMPNYSIIRNDGFVPEQTVHRDYEPRLA